MSTFCSAPSAARFTARRGTASTLGAASIVEAAIPVPPLLPTNSTGDHQGWPHEHRLSFDTRLATPGLLDRRRQRRAIPGQASLEGIRLVRPYCCLLMLLALFYRASLVEVKRMAAEQEVWDGDLASDSFLAGRLRAIQTLLMLLVDIRIFHGEDKVSSEEFMAAWNRADKVISDMDLTGAARNGFDETMKWFDKGLSAGSPFEARSDDLHSIE